MTITSSVSARAEMFQEITFLEYRSMIIHRYNLSRRFGIGNITDPNKIGRFLAEVLLQMIAAVSMAGMFIGSRWFVRRHFGEL